MARRDDDGSGHVTWRDFYTELEKVSGRVGRVEKLLLVLIVMVASPKVGGPSAPQLISALLGG